MRISLYQIFCFVRKPDEIAAAIAFLCSRGAAMITGHNLLIDGGMMLG